MLRISKYWSLGRKYIFFNVFILSESYMPSSGVNTVTRDKRYDKKKFKIWGGGGGGGKFLKKKIKKKF